MQQSRITRSDRRSHTLTLVVLASPLLWIALCIPLVKSVVGRDYRYDFTNHPRKLTSWTSLADHSSTTARDGKVPTNQRRLPTQPLNEWTGSRSSRAEQIETTSFNQHEHKRPWSGDKKWSDFVASSVSSKASRKQPTTSSNNNVTGFERQLTDLNRPRHGWLDSLAKIFYTHPLSSIGWHPTERMSWIDLSPDSIASPISGRSTLKHQVERLLGTRHNPRSNHDSPISDNRRSIMNDQAWLPSDESDSHNMSISPSSQYNPVGQATNLRNLLLTYARQLSPRQWRQFQSPTNRHRPLFNLALFNAVSLGFKRSVTECRHQFAKERWNCEQQRQRSSREDSSLFGNILLKGIPQTAFVRAILNAGLVQAVAEACLTHSLDSCPCNNRGRSVAASQAGDWLWQGCDHQVDYARLLAHRLLDREVGQGWLKSRINLANNKVGRQLVTENMERHCRCHGTSGACTLKTCYRKTPRMRSIGNLLKQIFDKKAVYIHPGNKELILSSRSAARVSPRKRYRFPRAIKHSFGTQYYQNHHQNKIITLSRRNPWPTGSSTTTRRFDASNQRLVNPLPPSYPLSTTNVIDSAALYFHEPLQSGLFCEARPWLGIVGTHNRACNSTSHDSDNCSHMCCGRGHRVDLVYEVERCQCRFVWCCKVECRQCLVMKRRESCL